MINKKIMLALPNNRWNNIRQWNDFPYTLGILNSVLKEKYKVQILDAGFYGLSKGETKKRIKEYSPDVVGISCLSWENDESIRELTSIIKSADKDIIIIVGGIYPTLLPEKVMENNDIDYAIMGEGEERFPRLLECLENGKSLEKLDGLIYRLNSMVVINQIENYIEDLDKLPLPCYDNIDFNAYANTYTKKSPHMVTKRFPYAQMITSRGCPLNCVFCSCKAINGAKIRYRSAESVLKEVDFLVKKYGVKDILFLDDNFYSDRKRAVKILNGLIKRNYDLGWRAVNSQVLTLDDELLELIKKAGCVQLVIAPECGSEEQLKLIGKPLATYSRTKEVVKKAKELGMITMASFVIGIPRETWEQIRKTGRFADELDLDFVFFNIATPLPRTRLYDIAKRDNLLPQGFDFTKIRGYGTPNIISKEYTGEELLMFRVMEWDRINFKTPEKVKKVAELCRMSEEEVEEWRVSTRRGLSN